MKSKIQKALKFVVSIKFSPPTSILDNQPFFQGLFSRITFNQPVYIGGQGQIKNTKSFLGVETGFQVTYFSKKILHKKKNKTYLISKFQKQSNSFSYVDSKITTVNFNTVSKWALVNY